MAIAQGELFPEHVALKQTPATDAGDAFVTQCAWCGLLVCADGKPRQLGLCPACAHPKRGWWAQALPVGPFKTRAP